VAEHDGKFPWTCLGKPLDDILQEIDITFEEFISICDRFTNKKIFKTDNEGNIIRNEDGDVVRIE
jgi:hypothetical protein